MAVSPMYSRPITCKGPLRVPLVFSLRSAGERTVSSTVLTASMSGFTSSIAALVSAGSGVIDLGYRGPSGKAKFQRSLNLIRRSGRGRAFLARLWGYFNTALSAGGVLSAQCPQ